MYNLRYHLASLVAVFFSLTIGLMLGTIVADRGTLDAQRDSIISSLRAEFDDLSTENSSLREERDSLSGFVDDTLPILVAGTLEGRSVVVLSNEGRTDGLGALTDAIHAAGGESIAVVLAADGLGLADPKVRAAAESVLGPLEDETAEETVAFALASEWTSTETQRPLTSVLQEVGVMRVEGLSPDTSANAIAVLASWAGEPDLAAIAIARGFRAADLPSVGVEAPTMPTGVAEAAVNGGLSAVDDIGSSQAAFSVAYVLAGKATGYFGVGPATVAPYPQIEPDATP